MFARGAIAAPRDPNEDLWSRFDVQGYLDHQGDKLAARLDANAYLAITKAMDLFEVAAAGYRTPTLLVAISSDWLYPPDKVGRSDRADGDR